ncbi:sodium, potassium, lithium and rubidium/H(+) antiporter [Paenibacillus sp. J31TS4]|uniref:Na+/H+ antiporter n=1 Tax=Paenibacillus sp. J31TS4 TaxID=2807195 RepID=UPI001B20687E|nr:Na+/H+ antiporter [Paenibacillus sp. J31TS4]GIP38576.1 sodium, potassium, lithium and rubidium/H(+) antiporter [Paenibacillus sp. J31TS4]
MELFLTVLLLIVLIGISNLLNRFVPFVPIPIFQIALGAAAVLLPFGIHLELEPELFFILFIAPLLFNDGKRTPRQELWHLRTPILLLALGLVFVTVLVGGYAIHWLIPSIPLPAAFALAGILSPTDPVAVGALAGRVRLPKSILRLLEGEALMNDASGLVAFRFAIAAMVTGAFSLADVAISFVKISLGGLACGVILSYFLIRLRIFIRRLGMEDVTIHMLIQILTPFLIFLVTEELGLSGILAVVAGGIVHAIRDDRAESSMAKLQIVSNSTWTVILFLLNGLVFVLLGMQLPDVAEVIVENEAISTLLALGYVVVISALLLLLRFIWVYVFWSGSWALGKGETQERPRLQTASVTSLAGVRGAVTLAGAFSIPYALMDGSPFPERDLIIFLSAGVILFTLILASVVLPLLSKGKSSADQDRGRKLQEAKLNILAAGAQAVRDEMTDANRAAALAVLSDFNRLVREVRNEEREGTFGFRSRRRELEIRKLALMAERKKTHLLLEEGKLSREQFYAIRETLNYKERALANRIRLRLTLPLIILLRRAARLFSRSGKLRRLPAEEAVRLRDIRIQLAQAAIAAIGENITDDNRNESLTVIADYNEMIGRLRIGPDRQPRDERFRKQKRELQYKAIQTERDEVQALFENGDISREIVRELRQHILYTETAMFGVEEGE